MTKEDKAKKYDEIVEVLLKNRNINSATREAKAIEEDGYFDADSYSGGNFDDAYIMGKENGEAEFIEDLLSILGYANSTNFQG
jgi:hypothetical protein